MALTEYFSRLKLQYIIFKKSRNISKYNYTQLQPYQLIIELMSSLVSSYEIVIFIFLFLRCSPTIIIGFVKPWQNDKFQLCLLYKDYLLYTYTSNSSYTR